MGLCCQTKTNDGKEYVDQKPLAPTTNQKLSKVPSEVPEPIQPESSKVQEEEVVEPEPEKEEIFPIVFNDQQLEELNGCDDADTVLSFGRQEGFDEIFKRNKDRHIKVNFDPDNNQDLTIKFVHQEPQDCNSNVFVKPYFSMNHLGKEQANENEKAGLTVVQ